MTARSPAEKQERLDGTDPSEAASGAGVRRHGFALADLRAHRSRTQAQLAEAIGTTQSAISRLERQPDLRVSTLAEYVSGTGGRLQLIADFGTYEVELDLAALRPGHLDPEQDFRVVWQNLQTRKLIHVGWLHVASGRYSFEYTEEAILDRDFQPFAQFPDLRKGYAASDLFSFFAERVAATAEPGFDGLADALGLNRDSATPIELLARSWGRSPHDTIQIVPEPERGPDGSLSRLFLVSGVSHANENDLARVSRLVSSLEQGQQLHLRDEHENPVDSRAIAVEVQGRRLGWVPAYLLTEVHAADRERVTVHVEHANGPGTPWHLRLLCRLVIAPAHGL